MNFLLQSASKACSLIRAKITAYAHQPSESQKFVKENLRVLRYIYCNYENVKSKAHGNKVGIDSCTQTLLVAEEHELLSQNSNKYSQKQDPLEIRSLSKLGLPLLDNEDNFMNIINELELYKSEMKTMEFQYFSFSKVIYPTIYLKAFECELSTVRDVFLIYTTFVEYQLIKWKPLSEENNITMTPKETIVNDSEQTPILNVNRETTVEYKLIKWKPLSEALPSQSKATLTSAHQIFRSPPEFWATLWYICHFFPASGLSPLELADKKVDTTNSHKLHLERPVKQHFSLTNLGYPTSFLQYFENQSSDMCVLNTTTVNESQLIKWEPISNSSDWKAEYIKPAKDSSTQMAKMHLECADLSTQTSPEYEIQMAQDITVLKSTLALKDVEAAMFENQYDIQSEVYNCNIEKMVQMEQEISLLKGTIALKDIEAAMFENQHELQCEKNSHNIELMAQMEDEITILKGAIALKDAEAAEYISKMIDTVENRTSSEVLSYQEPLDDVAVEIGISSEALPPLDAVESHSLIISDDTTSNADSRMEGYLYDMEEDPFERDCHYFDNDWAYTTAEAE